METVLTFLLVRFAVLAVIVAVLVIVGFALITRLKRRGRWEETRRRLGPVASRAAAGYARRRGGSWGSGFDQKVARRLGDRL
ncbi:hypothetical protein Psed_4610 [Pseudonocardia dioxanivorans CB1190]|uniref:Uncharacterized protein n=1 Tax=Pseudonocardia dioxanivorans (strain ATCC 55486 / DSM 44775 / JCM 13855 / CB1190) TaxID=675635 RepID=F4D0G4_PSEUX|nr:hypothetical protein [Pseudonocardia dioxanivorans]AEA26760.1 hypothetical protein Psed_4610 [Pseudonocardia dioxanivorans CB1190]GJF04798.1 hypothetical protein PSD17_37510 [Pseudonocardia sp. D17]